MAGYAPIAYTYEADHHCPDCTEERFGRHFETGVIADECDDTEGNPVGALFSWDCWWQGTDECETLHCGDCGELLDTAHSDPHSEDCDEWAPPADFVDAATDAYFETALWSTIIDSDEDCPPTYDSAGYTVDDIDPMSYGRHAVEVEEFIAANWAHVRDHSPARIGHDFWLTRERHGAGYWDGDYPAETGRRLTDAAHAYGEVCVYRGADEGPIYFD